MVRDAFISCELVRIDCQGLERSDYKKIGCKLRVNYILYLNAPYGYFYIVYKKMYDSTTSLFQIFTRTMKLGA